MVQCRGRDQQIEISDGQSSTLEITPQHPEALDDRAVQGQEPLAPKERPEATQGNLGSARIERPLIELTYLLT